MNRILGNSRGSSLVMSLLVLVVMALMTVGVYSITRVMLRESIYQMRLAQAQAHAEAGLEDALLQLRRTPSWRAGFTNKPFGTGSYTVTLSSDSSPWVTSKGVAKSIAILGKPDATVRAQALITRSVACTTFSNTDAVINGYIDSYDSAVSTTPTSFVKGGHFCSNDGMTVQSHGTPSLHMDVDYFGTPAPTASTIEGTLTKSTFSVILPTHDGSAYSSSNNNTTIPGTYLTGSNKKFTIPLNTAVTIYSGIYYFDTLTVTGNLRVNTSTGPVTLYVNGNVTISSTTGSGNGEITNLSGIPSNLRIYPQGTRTLTFQSKAPLYAIIESALSSVVIGQVIYGNVSGAKITINDPLTLHFDQQTVSGTLPTRVHWVTGSWSSSP